MTKGSGMNDEAADRQALARMAQGDQRALEEIAGRYHVRLWRYLNRQLATSPDLIEEVLQDVCLAVWRSASRYRGDAPPAAWIFQIAHFLVINARKANTRYANHAALPFADDAADAPASDSHEASVLDRITLTAALRTLTPKHTEILELIANEGFSMQEVAQILGIPVGTVKSRLAYARRALAAALEEGAHP